MKNKILVFTLISLIGTMAYARQSIAPIRGEPTALTAALENKQTTLDMQGRDYALIRVSKKVGTLASAKVVKEYLAYCRVLAVDQLSDTIDATVIVSFEYENDGGYNSCSLEIQSSEQSYEVELGTEAGE